MSSYTYESYESGNFKRNLMNELTEGIDALAERRKMERERLDERLGKNRERVNQEELYAPHMEEEQYINRNDLLKDYARIIDKCRKESEEIEQILGKALGYPWYKDDLKNFPNATEADGVCVGDHTAWSLAMCAADRIKMMDIREQDKQKMIDSQEEDIARMTVQDGFESGYQIGYKSGVAAVNKE